MVFLVLYCPLDIFRLSNDEWIIDFSAFDGSQDTLCFFYATFCL
jgi:hypothetical protein